MNIGDRIGVMRGEIPFIGEYHVPARVPIIIADDTRHTWIQTYDIIRKVNTPSELAAIMKKSKVMRDLLTGRIR